MAQDYKLAGLASMLRRAHVRLTEATERAHELGLTRLRDQMFDVELELVQLHRKVMELTEDPSSAGRPEPHGLLHQEELPF